MKKLILKVAVLFLLLYSLLLLSLYFIQESLIFQATTLSQEHKFEFKVPAELVEDLPFEEIFLSTNDGAQLNGIHFKRSKPKGIIIYYHGNAGDLSRWGQIIQAFLPYDYDVLIMDYRGYGKSTGQRSDSLLYKDALLFYEYAKQNFLEEQILVYGRSLGTTFASYAAAENNPSALILETPFYSLSQLVKAIYFFLPVEGMLKFQFPSNQILRRVEAPIYIFHGTKDQVVPYQQGVKLAEENPNCQLYTIENGMHNNLIEFSEYWVEMEKILKNGIETDQ